MSCPIAMQRRSQCSFFPSLIHLLHLRSSLLTLNSSFPFLFSSPVIQMLVSLCQKLMSISLSRLCLGFYLFSCRKRPHVQDFFPTQSKQLLQSRGVKSIQKMKGCALSVCRKKERESLLCFLCHKKNFCISQDLPEHQPEIS